MKRHELLAKAARARKTAMGKMRTHRKRGVELAGSEFDPRVGTNAQLRAMSDKQLVSYIDRLKRFNIRGNQYYLTASGGLVDSYTLDNYAYQLRRQERFYRDVDKPFEHLNHRDTMQSIAQRRAYEKSVDELSVFHAARRIDKTLQSADQMRAKYPKRQLIAFREQDKRAFDKRAADIKEKMARTENGPYLVRRAESIRKELLTELRGSKLHTADLERMIEGMGRKSLIAMHRHTDIAKHIRNMYELSKLNYSGVRLEGGVASGSEDATNTVRGILSAYAKADPST